MYAYIILILLKKSCHIIPFVVKKHKNPLANVTNTVYDNIIKIPTMAEMGNTLMISDIDNVFTATEAASLWGLAECTVRQAYRRGRFTKNEIRKAKGTILVTRQGMERLYGTQKEKDD